MPNVTTVHRIRVNIVLYIEWLSSLPIITNADDLQQKRGALSVYPLIF